MAKLGVECPLEKNKSGPPRKISREKDLKEVKCKKLMEMPVDCLPQQTAAQPTPQTLFEIQNQMANEDNSQDSLE